MNDSLLARTANHILSRALESEHGIEVLVSSADQIAGLTLRAKQVLYRFKTENPDFKNLQIRFSPDDPDKKLWIIKGPDQ